MVTDINNPAGSSEAQSTIVIMIDEYDAVEMALASLKLWHSNYVQFLIKCDKEEEINDDDYDRLKVCLLT